MHVHTCTQEVKASDERSRTLSLARVTSFTVTLSSPICLCHGFVFPHEYPFLDWRPDISALLSPPPLSEGTALKRMLSLSFASQTIEELEKELLNGQKLQGPQTSAEVYRILKQKELLDK